jgi:hypothetical protein
MVLIARSPYLDLSAQAHSWTGGCIRFVFIRSAEELDLHHADSIPNLRDKDQVTCQR